MAYKAVVRVDVRCQHHTRFHPERDGLGAVRGNCPACLAICDIYAAIRKALTEPENRMRAVNTALAYGFGRPVARIDMRVIRSISDLTDEELLALRASAASDGDHAEQEAIH